jgi:hypothetical protein
VSIARAHCHRRMISGARACSRDLTFHGAFDNFLEGVFVVESTYYPMHLPIPRMEV